MFFIFLSARESFSWLANLNMKRHGGSCDNKTIGNATRGWDFPLLWFEVGGKINATDCPGDFFNKKNKKTGVYAPHKMLHKCRQR